MRKLYVLLILSIFYTFSYAQVSTLIDSFPGSGGVKLGPDGHLYIGNYGDALTNANGNQIWRYHIKQDSLELFATGLFGASGNDFGPNGNFYQSNIAAGLVSKVTPSGQVSTYASGLSSPVGIVADDTGNLYVCECGSNEVSKIDTNGVVSLFSTGLLVCPNGITKDPNGNFYVSNFNNSNVIKINPAGQQSVFAVISGNNNGHLTYSDNDSCLYVASHGTSRIYKVSLGGTVSILAGSGARGNQDGTLNQATFSRPNGVAMSQSGDTIFVNSSIPLTNGPTFPLNPSKLRAITGFRILTTAAEEEKVAFNIYPNPSKGIIEITGLNSGIYILNLYSIRGNSIYEKTVDVDNNEALLVDLFDPESRMGMFFLTIKNSDFYHSQRLILQKSE